MKRTIVGLNNSFIPLKVKHNFVVKRKNRIPNRITLGLKDGILPFTIMCITMVLSIILFRLFRAANTTVIQPVFDIDGEETNPTIGRLIYCVLSFAISMFLVTVAHKLYVRNKNTLLVPWTLAVTGGTMLWQCIGESVWHYGLNVLTEEGDLSFINFPRIESIQGLPIIILTLLLLFTMHDRLGFGVVSWLAAFMGNWFGHIIMIGTFPIAMALGYNGSVADWYRIIGYIGAAAFGIIGLYFMFGNTKRETKYLASTYLFIAYGCLMYGIIKN